GRLAPRTQSQPRAGAAVGHRPGRGAGVGPSGPALRNGRIVATTGALPSGRHGDRPPGATGPRARSADRRTRVIQARGLTLASDALLAMSPRSTQLGGAEMRCFMPTLTLLMSGCSTAPVADLLDVV